MSETTSRVTTITPKQGDPVRIIGGNYDGCILTYVKPNGTTYHTVIQAGSERMLRCGVEYYDRAYEELKQRCLPHIEAYHDDLLVHDRNHLAKWPGVPFLHWTRKCGTDLTMMYPHDSPAWPAEGEKVPYIFGTATREHVLGQNESMGKYHRDKRDGELAHHYNGKTVFPVTLQRAVDIIEDYARSVRHSWTSTINARNAALAQR